MHSLSQINFRKKHDQQLQANSKKRKHIYVKNNRLSKRNRLLLSAYQHIMMKYAKPTTHENSPFFGRTSHRNERFNIERGYMTLSRENKC